MDDTIKGAAKRAVVAVDGRRGFIIEATLDHIQGRLIVTAAHCLPRLPPALATASAEERTYPKLLGPLGKRRPQVSAECVFADPVADIAVLAAPDDQQRWEEAKLNGSYWDLLYDLNHLYELNERDRGSTSPINDAIRANLRENRADTTRPPLFAITPRSLKDALWLQFKIAVSNNTQLQQCTECPTWFAYGAGTGRRKSALYCSPKCSKAAYRRRKAASQ